MQIHEITKPKDGDQVNEVLGGLGRLAGKVASGVGSMTQKLNPLGGFTSGYKQAKTAGQTAMLGKKVADIWGAYVERLKATAPDPARYEDLYQKSLQAFVQKNLLGGQNINYAVNRQELNKLIDDITAQRDNPRAVATLIPKLVQQASVSQQDVSQGQSLVKVVSVNPAVIQYRNINYAINNTGEWANQTTGRVPDESFQAFFDQELSKAGGVAPSPTNTPTSASPLGQNVRRASRRRPGTA